MLSDGSKMIVNAVVALITSLTMCFVFITEYSLAISAQLLVNRQRNILLPEKLNLLHRDMVIKINTLSENSYLLLSK